MNALHPQPELILVKYGYHNRDLGAIAEIHQVERCGYTYSRTDLLKEFPERWILFFDADCEIEEDQVTTIQYALPQLNKKTIYAGRYHNTIQAPSFVRAYNFVCNTWADSNHTFLGGCFLIFANSDLQNQNVQFEFSKAPRWGGEEIWILNTVLRLGYHVKQHDFLNVTHAPCESFPRFLRRAFIQGAHRTSRSHVDCLEFSSQQMHSSKFFPIRSFLFWAHKMRGLSISEMFWVLAHFVFVFLGILFQKPFPKSRPPTH